MLANLAIPVLGAPAMFAAGLLSSAHCALMCGLVQARAAPGRGATLQLGRMLGYTLLGAVAGGAGSWLLRASAAVPVAEFLRMAAVPILLGLIVWQAATHRQRPCCVAGRVHRSHLTAAAAGVAMGLTPCALLYAAAGYAALSGTALQGALLMLAFGLGTLPGLQAGAWAWTRVTTASVAGGNGAGPAALRLWQWLVMGAALLLAAGGLIGVPLLQACLN